jgi:pantetheine-phosphate adenylyltransferase
VPTARAACPGSFDPFTLGHLDVVRRAAQLFDEVVVAVGRNTAKNSLFTPEERLDLARVSLKGLANVSVKPLEQGLLVDFCRDNACDWIVKGVRFAGDFDYELQMYRMNHSLSGVETMFLPATADYATLSSTILREVALNGGDVSHLVTPEVNQAVLAKVAALRNPE